MDGNSSTRDLLERSQVEIGVEVFFAFVLFISSIITNSVVIYVIHKDHSLETITNAFIVNLSFVDLALSVLLMPLWIASLLRGNWIFGDIVCNLAAYFYYALSNASLNTLLVIAVTRYLKVVKTQVHSKIFGNKRNTKIMKILAWIVPLVLCSPPLYGWGHFTFYPHSAMCILETAYTNTGYITFMVLSQPSPYIICFCYYHIYRTVRENRVQICSRHNRAACQSAHDAEAHLIHTTFAIVCVFVLCWSPSIIAHFLISSHVSSVGWLLMLSTYLVFLACSLNPVIYGFMNPQFKRALKMNFTCQARIHSSECSTQCCGQSKNTDLPNVTEIAIS